MLRTLGLALIGGVLSFLLSEMGSKHTRLVGVICAVGVLISALVGISGISDEIHALIGEGVSGVAVDGMKILGAGYAFGISADTLDTLGEGHIARALDVACRVEITLIALPYVKEIIECALTLIK